MINRAIQVLIEAKQLLVTMGWTQGVFARDGRGLKVSPYGQEAACFCSLGALDSAAHKFGLQDHQWVGGRFVLSDLMGGSISAYNDAAGRTQEEVIAAFDAAIAKVSA